MDTPPSGLAPHDHHSFHQLWFFTRSFVRKYCPVGERALGSALRGWVLVLPLLWEPRTPLRGHVSPSDIDQTPITPPQPPPPTPHFWESEPEAPFKAASVIIHYTQMNCSGEGLIRYLVNWVSLGTGSLVGPLLSFRTTVSPSSDTVSQGWQVCSFRGK